MTSPGVVIVGGGQSAAVAAHTLREQGYQGRITMIGRERHRPYERPALSKAVLTAEEEPRLDVLTEDAWVRSNVELLSESEAVAMDLQRRNVRLADGRVIAYDRCLIATGGEALTLPCVPIAHPGVHHIRTLDDARRLRASLRGKPQVAILGGGFLGLEVSHSSLSFGASVTVLERAAHLLDRFLPREASAWLEARMRDAGAKLLLGTSLSDVQALPSGRMRLTTSAGHLEVDELIVAVGLSPNDSLAREAGIELAAGGGILVDASCRTSNDRVFACGDCTSQQRPGQTIPTRLESWQNATEQARIAAAAMLDAPLPAPPVPWFWTDQGQHNIQVLGLPAPDLQYVRRGDPVSEKVMWIGHRGSVPMHGVAINAGADLRAVRPLFERGQPVTWDDFPLHTTNLRAWVKQVQAHVNATV
jgi:3-phenylpropionate/trans-cinnamate dioxygenase ferredoxin reductase subunit